MSEQPIRVLLLDDEESLRKPLTDYLHNTHGFIVDATGDGNEALRLVEEAQGRYDVALVDEVLAEPPGGLDVLREIKARYPEIEVILFTAWEMKAGIEALRAGAYRYLAKPFDKDELAITIRFAAEYGQTRRERKILSAFQQVATAISSTLDPKEILKRTCQAAVELFDVDHSGMVRFEDGEHGTVVAEFPDKGTLGRVIQVRGIPPEERLVYQQEVLNIPDVEAEDTLGSVRDTLLGFGVQSILIVPVVLQNKVVASFSLDTIGRKHTFYPNEIELCTSLANQVAVAIENSRLFAEEQEATRRLEKQAERLRALYEIGSEITSARDMEFIWNSIAEQTARLVGARRSLFILADIKAHRLLKATGWGYPAEHLQKITIEEVEAGVSGWVLRKKEPVLVADARSDPRNTGVALERAMDFQTAPLIVVPLLIRDKALGTLTAVNTVGDPPFSEDDKDLVAMLATQAAIAYDNTRRMYELEQLRLAADAMASPAKWKDVLQAIAKSAKQVLEADYALIWPYDAERKIFFPEDLVAEGIQDDLLAEFRNSEPEPGSITKRVLQDGYVPVEDLDSTQAKFVREKTRGFLTRLAVKSFQGILLDVAGEPLGVLLVDYKHARGFGDEDRRILENFANHAALILKKTRLHEQVRRSQEAARAVAQVITLGDLDKTLGTTVESAHTVLRCDIATLYTFDGNSQQFIHSKVAGVDSSHLKPLEAISKDSVLWKIIGLAAPYYYVTDKASDDELTKGRFVKDHHIGSVLGIQLRVGERRVGVMFINYCTPHRFTQDEIDDALQFAHQAAIAIRNTQLHDEARKRAEVMGGLYEAGKAITSTLALEETLAHVAEQALHVVGANCPNVGCFSHIALREGDKLRFAAAWPPERLMPLQQQIDIDLNSKSDHTIGIAGRCVKDRKPQKVDDVHSQEEKDYIEAVKETRSQLSVPLKIGERIIGVLSIEHPKPAAFGDEDVKNIELLAAQAAVAIENARLYNAAEQRAKNLHAVLNVSQTSISSLDLTQILNATCQASVELLNVDHSGLVLFDQDLVSGKVYAEHPEIDTVGVEFPLHGVPAEERLIATKKPLMVPDVANELGFEPVRELLTKLGTCSILIVPIVSKGQILGSLGLDVMKSRRVFTEEEKELCQIFAAQVAVAIENARRYEDLRTMKALVGTRTATEWMKMVSYAWGHAIKRETGLALRYIALIRQDWENGNSSQANQDLSRLADVIERIKDIPIVAPLAEGDRVMHVAINGLLRRHVDRLWQHEPYKSTVLSWNLQSDLDDLAVVVASPQWVLRAIEIFLSNSIEAMMEADTSTRQVEIATQISGNMLEILVKDSGPGFPPHMPIEKIGIEPVYKPEGSRGAGVGLVLAKLIAQTYGGDIRAVDTRGTGAIIVMSLPYTRI